LRPKQTLVWISPPDPCNSKLIEKAKEEIDYNAAIERINPLLKQLAKAFNILLKRYQKPLKVKAFLSK